MSDIDLCGVKFSVFGTEYTCCVQAGHGGGHCALSGDRVMAATFKLTQDKPQPVDGDLVEAMKGAYNNAYCKSVPGSAMDRGMTAAFAVAEPLIAAEAIQKRDEQWEKEIKEEYAFTDGHGSTWWFDRVRARLQPGKTAETPQQIVERMLLGYYPDYAQANKVSAEIITALRESEGAV